MSPLLVPLLVVVVVGTVGVEGGAAAPGPATATAPGIVSGCSLTGRATAAEIHVMERIRHLRGLRFQAVTEGEGEGGGDSYTYTFSLCSSVSDVDPLAGLIQTRSRSGSSSKLSDTTVIGRFNSTQIIGGSDWIIVIYGAGDPYASHCGKEPRRAMVMISCGPPGSAAFSVVSEERDKEADCFYLFELDTDTVCPVKAPKISTGSVLLILLLVLAAIYLLGGLIYQRMVVGAKGFDQFPHRGMWQELGNLTADGCDFVFRSSPAAPPPSYRGAASSDPLDEVGEEDERDEHLLPM